MNTTSTAGRVRWKAIVMPAEHGGWGFLLEPILLGLLVAPSWAGACLAGAAFGAFLMQQPLKLAYTDRRRGRRYARTAAAEHALIVLGGLTALVLVGAVALGGVSPLIPLVLAAPLGLIQVIGALRNRGRALARELTGALALAAAAPAIALAGDAAPAVAFGLWAVLAARDIPSIVYVRARLRLEKGKPADRRAVLWTHGAALLAGVALVVLDRVPALSLVALGVLAVRAAHGVSRWRRPVPARTIGFMEIGYGLLAVLLTAWGVAAGL